MVFGLKLRRLISQVGFGEMHRFSLKKKKQKKENRYNTKKQNTMMRVEGGSVGWRLESRLWETA